MIDFFCIPEFIFRILGRDKGERGKSTICLGQIDRIGNEIDSKSETLIRIVMHSNSRMTDRQNHDTL